MNINKLFFISLIIFILTIGVTSATDNSSYIQSIDEYNTFHNDLAIDDNYGDNLAIVIDDGAVDDYDDNLDIAVNDNITGNDDLKSENNLNGQNEDLLADRKNIEVSTFNVTVDPGQKASMTFNFTPSFTGSFTLTVDNGESEVYNGTNLGSFGYSISGLAAGNHYVTLKTIENDNFTSGSATSVITVNKLIPELSVVASKTDINIGDSLTVTVNGVPAGSGLTVLDNGEKIEVNIADNSFNYTPAHIGEHNITVVSSAYGNYDSSNASTTVHVNKSGLKLKVSANTTSIAAGLNITITVDGLVNNENAIVYDNNTPINVSFENNTFKYSSLVVGNHNISIKCLETDDYYESDGSIMINILEKPKFRIITSNVTVNYGEDASVIFKFEPTFTGEFIITVSSGYSKSNTVTNESSYKFTLNKFPVGKYKLNLTTVANENFNSTTAIAYVNVLSNDNSTSNSKKDVQLIFNNMTTNVVLNNQRLGEWFNVTLKDTNNKALANKKIYIGFNGKIYEKTTDSNGKVSLQINIGYKSANTFSITFLGDEEYNGKMECAIIVVNSLKTYIVPYKITYYSSTKTKVLKAYLKLYNGTVVKSKPLTFTFDGKQIFTSNTNSKGLSSVKISLSSKKTYKYTVTFEGDLQYDSSNAKSTIIIK